MNYWSYIAILLTLYVVFSCAFMFVTYRLNRKVQKLEDHYRHELKVLRSNWDIAAQEAQGWKESYKILEQREKDNGKPKRKRNYD